VLVIQDPSHTFGVTPQFTLQQLVISTEGRDLNPSLSVKSVAIVCSSPLCFF